MTFGPSDIFPGKKERKPESTSRTTSSSTMSQMFNQTPETGIDATKGNHSHRLNISIDLSNTGIPEAPAQRKRLILAPRSTAVAGGHEIAASNFELESKGKARAEAEMTEEQAEKKIAEYSKQLFTVRNLDEAEAYFTNLPAAHHFKLVNEFASTAVEWNELDAQLVADLFARAASMERCAPAAFEEGLSPIADIIDDIAINAPMAPSLFMILVKGAGLDEERRMRLASKSMNSDELLALLL
jgi:translation initiation factor 4G